MAADIRPAHADDIDALAAIEEAVFETDRLSRRSFRHLLQSRSAAVLVAPGDEGAAGYSVVLFRAGSSKARLYSIAVSSNNSARGAGRALLMASESEAVRRGAVTLNLEVRRDNPRAIDLYERSGYRPAGVEADYYADGMTALRFEKLLVGTPKHAGTVS